MTKSRFRPGVAATISVLIMLPILIGLGVWQIQRLAWKTALIARLEQQIHASPVAVPPSIDNLADWSLKPVTVQGIYDPATIAIIPGRVHQGVLGSKILTLLRRSDGVAVVIDRGWVPQADVADWLAQKNLPPTGVRSISGLARVPEAGNIFTPHNQPEQHIWYQPDPLAMARYWDITGVAPIWVQQTVPETQPRAPVIGTLPSPDLPNNHLGYAITWFGLALVLLVIYLVFGLKRGHSLDRPFPENTGSRSLSES